MPSKKLCVWTIALLLGSLNGTGQNVTISHYGYRINDTLRKDSAMLRFLSYYKDSITGSMGKVIGFSPSAMYKKQPESSLGNWMADAIRTQAEKIFGTKVDAAFLNYGGIRSYISKGDVTVGKVFELIPFDNLLVLQKVRGDSLASFFELMARKGGWPMSGSAMKIENHRPKDILVNGKSLINDSIYTIANSDYLANGGDNASMLKCFKTINKGVLLRDALIEHIKETTQAGNPVEAIKGRKPTSNNE